MSGLTLIYRICIINALVLTMCSIKGWFSLLIGIIALVAMAVTVIEAMSP